MADVLSLELEKDLPPQVDAIWASPPWTHYSSARARARTPRDLEGSDALVRKVLAIFEPTESQTGLWRTLIVV